MKCIWCKENEATDEAYDVGFCAVCYDNLEEWDKVCVAGTFEGACWKLGKQIEAFKQEVRAGLHPWLRWLVRK